MCPSKNLKKLYIQENAPIVLKKFLQKQKFASIAGEMSNPYQFHKQQRIKYALIVVPI